MVTETASVFTRNGCIAVVPAGIGMIGDDEPATVSVIEETTLALCGAVRSSLIAPSVAVVPPVNCSVSFTLPAVFTIELAGILHQAEKFCQLVLLIPWKGNAATFAPALVPAGPAGP